MNKKLPIGLGFAAFSFLVLGCTSQEKSMPVSVKSPETTTTPSATTPPSPPTLSAEEEAAELATTARLVPYEKDGIKGLVIDSIQKDSAWSLAGLKEGDVITKVGGKPATGQVEMVALLRAMEISPTPKLDVLREGKLVKIRPKITRK